MSPHPAEQNPAHFLHLLGPALQAKPSTPRVRAELLYDVITVMYDHVKFHVQNNPEDQSPELQRIGALRDAAMPPSDEVLQAESGDTGSQ